MTAVRKGLEETKERYLVRRKAWVRRVLRANAGDVDGSAVEGCENEARGE